MTFLNIITKIKTKLSWTKHAASYGYAAWRVEDKEALCNQTKLE